MAAGSDKNTHTVRGLVGALGFALAGVACPEPRNGDPQIAISPGAAARTNLIPSRRAGKKAVDPNGKARIHSMRAGEALAGPNATGKIGDWMLENGEVVFVIDALGGGAGFAQSGGNVIDAADATVRKDELGQFFTYFGVFPRQGVYTKLTSRIDADGAGVVVVTGAELYDPQITVETEYRLGAADRALLVTTKLTNFGPVAVTLGLGDALQWGGAEKIAPGKPINFSGRSQGPYIGGVGRFVSYGLTTPAGEIAAMNGGTWTDTEQVKSIALAPGATTAYARVFVVGARGDSASVVAELTAAANGELGTIELTLVDDKGKAVAAGERARVGLAAAADGPDVLFVTASANGFAGDVPPGRWFLRYAPSAGRSGTGPRVAVDVRKEATTKATVAVSGSGSLEVGCMDPVQRRVPCKVAVEGIDGSITPELGPAHLASTARNVLFAAEANARTALAPGRYRLTATRGPEWASDTRDVTVAGVVEETFTLAHVVDTRGWVGADFHQHTILSGDSPVALADRVRANACEGVEVAVASEHNVVADLEPFVKELGLAEFLVEIAGDEVTTDADKKPWGHANVFPLPVRADAPRGGALPYLNVTPKQTFDAARALPGLPIVQVNHPRSGLNGYFDQMGFDPRTGAGTRAGYDPTFDSIEVWNGRSVTARAKVLDDFFALLRTKHPVTAVADTDTHGIVGQEPGYPRTYVHMDDQDLGRWSDARSGKLVNAIRTTREVLLTNGPFLTVSINGGRIGSVVRGGSFEVRVHVQSAPFVEVTTVALRFGNANAPAPITVTPKKNAAGALEADAVFRVHATLDDVFVVIASGTKPMRTMLAGDDEEIAPYAMTGATWIDADGDGKSLGR